jgi:hypothetical protein
MCHKFPRLLQCHSCAVILKKLIFTNSGKWPGVTWDNNRCNYINNILYRKVKYFSSKHITVISFLWVYSIHEIKKYDFLSYFQKKIREEVKGNYQQNKKWWKRKEIQDLGHGIPISNNFFYMSLNMYSDSVSRICNFKIFESRNIYNIV